ncbi:MAG: hypothetical protein GXP25_19345, partial [Planctomycetes bacterium]|nr:hypothetical protein [Planctomycetota bacterium]
METIRKQMAAMDREMKGLKDKELDKKIDVLSKRLDKVKAATPESTAGYKKHFYIKSADDMFALQFFGRVQF